MQNGHFTRGKVKEISSLSGLYWSGHLSYWCAHTCTTATCLGPVHSSSDSLCLCVNVSLRCSFISALSHYSPLTHTFLFIHSLRSAPSKTKPNVYLCSCIWVHEASDILWLCCCLSALTLGYLRKQIILKGFECICSHKRSLILNHLFSPLLL